MQKEWKAKNAMGGGEIIDEMPYKIYSNEVVIPLYDVYLTGSIGHPDNYYDLLAMLRGCCSDTLVNLYVNSNGGIISAATQIINAMRDSRATITTILDCEAYSAAGLIFLAGDRFIVKDGSSLMCHLYYSTHVEMKGNEMKTSVAFHDELYKEMFKTSYRGFLADKEIEGMFNGQDFWFDKPEIIKRLKKVAKLRGEDIVDVVVEM